LLQQQTIGHSAPLPGAVQDFARARRHAARNTRRVRVLRWLFPILGGLILLGMIGLIVLFNILSGLGLGALSITGEGLVMDRPELSGHDGERSYKVSALRAVQHLTDPRVIDLETIRAEIVLNAEQSASITALKGTYDNGAETLKLYDGIQLEWSEGYKVDLADVQINLKSGALSTSDPISIRSDKGQVRAGTFSYDQDNGIARFRDGIKMVLNPSAKEIAQ